MKSKIIPISAISIGVFFVFGMYLYWEYHDRKFEDLGVLFNGLAFLVIYVTLITQQSTTSRTLKHLEEQVKAQKHLANIQALSVVRENTGARIHYLRKLIRQQSHDGKDLSVEILNDKRKDLEFEGLTEETAKKRIYELKTRLLEFERRMEYIKV